MDGIVFLFQLGVGVFLVAAFLKSRAKGSKSEVHYQDHVGKITKYSSPTLITTDTLEDELTEELDDLFSSEADSLHEMQGDACTEQSVNHGDVANDFTSSGNSYESTSFDSSSSCDSY